MNEFNVQEIDTYFSQIKNSFNQPQQEFFEMIIHQLNKIPLQFTNVENLLKEKVSKEAVYKVISLKANVKDVQNGFTNIKSYYNNLLKEKQFDFVTREEVGKLNQQNIISSCDFDFGTVDKMNKIQLEKIVDNKLKEFLKISDFEIAIDQKELQYAKKQELFPIQEEIQSLNSQFANQEVEMRLKNDDLEELIKEQERNFDKKLKQLEKFIKQQNFVKLSEIDFLDKDEYEILKEKLQCLEQLEIKKFIEKYLTSKKTLLNKSNEIKANFESLEQRFKNDIEKLQSINKQNLLQIKQEFLKQKNKQQEYNEQQNYDEFEQQIQEQNLKFFEIENKLKNQEKQINLFNKNKQTIQQNSSRISEVSQQLVEINEQYLQIQNNNFEQQLQELKKNMMTYKDQINNIKCELFQKIKKQEKEINFIQISQENQKIKKIKKPEKQSVEKNFSIKKFSDYDEQIRDLKDQLFQSTQKYPQQDFDQNYFNNELKKLKNEIKKKIDSKEIMKFIKQKANVKEINTIFKDLYDELDKIPKEISKNQLSALYLWNTGKTIVGKIAWEKEAFNNDPSNFILSGNKFQILIVNEGLYEIKFGVFGNIFPKLQICLNDEEITSSQKMMNQYLQKEEYRHSSGNVIVRFV